MATTLDPTAAASADAVRALERALADTRTQWDDPARRTFDQRHAVVILGDAKQTLADLTAERSPRAFTTSTRASALRPRPANHVSAVPPSPSK
jgi:hypothetical protein